MSKTKRTYTREFKEEAVRLWESSGRSVATVEQELGITAGLLNKWKGQMKRAGAEAIPGRGRLPAGEERVRQLERESAILRQEQDILSPFLIMEWLTSPSVQPTETSLLQSRPKTPVVQPYNYALRFTFYAICRSAARAA